MLRILTKVNYLDVEDYKKDRVEEQYDGVEDDIHAPSSFIDGLFNEGVMEFDYGDSLYENQFTIVKNQNQSALGQYRDNKVELIKEQTVHSITTRNKEQHFAMKALMDKSIDMVTITGVAGTGKTLLALAAGLEQVLETKDYNRVLVARPTVTNNDLGYLPGDKEEKLRPWMQPIYDNIDFIYDQRESEEVVEDFKTIDKLKVEALAYIRGRSIPKQFFIIDEAQNLTPDKVKTIVSRAGEGTKIVLTGDVEQIDAHYLDQYSNGLSYVINKFKGKRNYAHVELKENERSLLAEQAAQLL
jgi:PhoH-like ATPase